MQDWNRSSVDLSRPEEIAYWCRLLKIHPGHLAKAVKATGSTLVNRLVYFLKAEGLLPYHFDLGKLFSPGS